MGDSTMKGVKEGIRVQAEHLTAGNCIRRGELANRSWLMLLACVRFFLPILLDIQYLVGSSPYT